MGIMDSPWFWLILTAFTSALFVILIKWYTVYPKAYIWLFIFLIGGVIDAYCYYRVFRMEPSSVGYPIAKSLSIVIVVLVGVFLFHEKVNTVAIGGIIFIMIGIAALFYTSNSAHGAIKKTS